MSSESILIDYALESDFEARRLLLIDVLESVSGINDLVLHRGVQDTKKNFFLREINKVKPDFFELATVQRMKEIVYAVYSKIDPVDFSSKKANSNFALCQSFIEYIGPGNQPNELDRLDHLKTTLFNHKTGLGSVLQKVKKLPDIDLGILEERHRVGTLSSGNDGRIIFTDEFGGIYQMSPKSNINKEYLEVMFTGYFSGDVLERLNEQKIIVCLDSKNEFVYEIYSPSER